MSGRGFLLRLKLMKQPRKRQKLQRLAAATLAVVVLGIGIATVLSYALAGARDSRPPVSRTAHARASAPPGRAVLKVMTLNVAHGRKDGTHQLLQSTATIRAHLDDIARVLSRVSPDVAALQEADGPSFWSGNFDHVAYLAEESSFGYFVRGEHVSGMKLSYGTALVSGLPLENARSVTFAPSPPTPAKGFLVATVEWPLPSGQSSRVDIVAVHLDFSRQSARDSQVDEIVRALSPRRRPLIIMGDFNCSWTGEEPTLRTLAEKLGLRAFRPEQPSAQLVTFPARQRRLDWILISSELEFVSCEVLPDVLSDHRAVVSEITFAQEN